MPAAPLQAKSGMQVAGQHVVARVRFGFVLQGEGAEQQRFGHDADVQLLGWIARAAVMVAAYQGDFQPRMSLAPGEQLCVRRRRAGFGGVQEVTEEDQPAAGVLRQQCVEALQVGLGGALGHRLAEPSIGRGLAEMNIGDQQRPFARPVDGLVGEQPEFGLFQFDGKVGVHRCPVAGRFRRLSGRTRSVGRCVRLVGPNSFGQRLCQAEQVRPYGRHLRGLGVPSLRTRGLRFGPVSFSTAMAAFRSG